MTVVKCDKCKKEIPSGIHLLEGKEQFGFKSLNIKATITTSAQLDLCERCAIETVVQAIDTRPKLEGQVAKS